MLSWLTALSPSGQDDSDHRAAILIGVLVVVGVGGLVVGALWLRWMSRGHPPTRTPQEVYDETGDEYKRPSSWRWLGGFSGSGPAGGSP